MSNKNLLNENTVRRFMKLAEIEPLTNQFVDKINEADYKKDKKHGKEDDKVEEAKHGKEDDKVEEAMHGEEDGKVEEAMHGEEDGKFEFEEGMYSDDDGDADHLDDIMEEDYDGLIDEDLENFLAELDMQDDEEEMPEMGAEDVELDVEEPAAAPAMGGIDPAELGEMVKDAVMDALKQLVADGDLDVSMDSETEEIDVEGEEEEPDEEDEMVNEVARRVLKRIINSRR